MKYSLMITLLFFSVFAKAADFGTFFPHIIKVEGVMFTVTQYDKGGATKFGVTYSTYKTWCNSKRIEIVPCDKDKDGFISKNDLRLTVLQDIKPIYKVCYWDVVKADSIKNQAIAELFVDFIINSGSGYNNRNIKVIQALVGVLTDGKIGAKTLKAINDYPPDKLYSKLYKHRVNYFHKIGHGTQRKFLRGWLNRLNILKSIHKNYPILT